MNGKLSIRVSRPALVSSFELVVPGSSWQIVGGFSVDSWSCVSRSLPASRAASGASLVRSREHALPAARVFVRKSIHAQEHKEHHANIYGNRVKIHPIVAGSASGGIWGARLQECGRLATPEISDRHFSNHVDFVGILGIHWGELRSLSIAILNQVPEK